MSPKPNTQNDSEDENDNEDIETDVPLSRLLRVNSSEWHYISMACVCSLIIGGAQPLFAVLVAQYLKMFMISADEQTKATNQLMLLILLLAFCSSLLRFINNVFFCLTGSRLTIRIRQRVFESLMWQDMQFFDDIRHTVGRLTSMLANDATLIQGAGGVNTGFSLETFSTVLCIYIVIFIYNWKMSLVMMVFLPLMIAVGVFQGKAIKGFSQESQKSLKESGKIVSEAISNIRQVATLGREETFLSNFTLIMDDIFKMKLKAIVIQSLAYSFSEFMVYISYAVGFAYGTYLIKEENIPIENVYKIVSAIIFGGWMLGRNTAFAPDFNKGRLAANRLFSIIDRKPNIDARCYNNQGQTPLSGKIKIQNVKFAYPNRSSIPILEDFNLEINSKQTTAIVGYSGCGKSTIVNLVARLYDPQHGQIMTQHEFESPGMDQTERMNYSDISSLDIPWYRYQMGVVSQEPVLFDMSIASNIAYGYNAREVTMEEIIEAARTANIHQFISSLPCGYETIVGNKGKQLSGGQKQRVAIARAIIRKPLLLLLDEATSALDSVNEKVVQAALDKAMKGRTCLVIAHRLSTITNADKIVVLNKGQVVDSGTHSELISKKGEYFNLIQYSVMNR